MCRHKSLEKAYLWTRYTVEMLALSWGTDRPVVMNLTDPKAQWRNSQVLGESSPWLLCCLEGWVLGSPAQEKLPERLLCCETLSVGTQVRQNSHCAGVREGELILGRMKQTSTCMSKPRPSPQVCGTCFYHGLTLDHFMGSWSRHPVGP